MAQPEGRGAMPAPADGSIRRSRAPGFQGAAFTSSAVMSDDATAGASHGLTAQETECLRWCKEGKTNWEIGAILAISAKTVEFHLANAMRKLGAANRITAVVIGIRRGIIRL